MRTICTIGGQAVEVREVWDAIKDGHGLNRQRAWSSARVALRTNHEYDTLDDLAEALAAMRSMGMAEDYVIVVVEHEDGRHETAHACCVAE